MEHAQAPAPFEPRTDEEILARIAELEDEDFLGFETADLKTRLPFQLAKQFLKAGVEESQWEQYERDRDIILAEMLEYMPFAWEKANNQRGISANRSIAHYQSWVWLIRDEHYFPNMMQYEFYGKDKLAQICKHYGWDSSQWDDGVRING